MEDILNKEHWLTIPFAPDYEVSEGGSVRQSNNGQLLIPDAAHIILNVPIARLVASVWHSHLTGKTIPADPSAELLFIDGNSDNLSYNNLAFEGEMTDHDFNELDILNT